MLNQDPLYLFLISPKKNIQYGKVIAPILNFKDSILISRFEIAVKKGSIHRIICGE
jgi:hypothetical protein